MGTLSVVPSKGGAMTFFTKEELKMIRDNAESTFDYLDAVTNSYLDMGPLFQSDVEEQVEKIRILESILKKVDTL